ncbi:MAG: MEDS domain-containing protein [Alphaproteobacteria bacterium]|nr:MEDS domain-containing protein [Alphaproteobacteria bacterium]
MTDSRHQCFIYEGDPARHLSALAAAIREKLAGHYRCLYLHSPSVVEVMRALLEELRVDVGDAVAGGALVLSSAPVVSEDGVFDTEAMIRKLEEAVNQALRDGYKGLFATGDMTWELGANKDNFSKLLEYEWRLEKLFQKQPALCGICQYHHDTLPREVMRQGLLSHRTVFVNETLSRINSHYAGSIPRAEAASRDPKLDQAITALCRSAAMA